MADLSTAESRQIKLSPAGIPVEDDDLFDEQKTYSPSKPYPFSLDHHQPHHTDDDAIILDDGETSQMDLVGYASKN